MKNLDFKKLLVFIIIIIIIGLLIFGSVKFLGKGSSNRQEEDKIKENIEKYFSKITEGYSTIYGGTDILYSNDKTTLNDLEDKNILNMAIKYASENKLDISVAISDLNAINEEGSYGDIKEYTAYNGKGVRQAAKELFGKDIEDKSVVSTSGFIYDFFYISEFDLYLVKRNNVPDISSDKQKIEYKVIKTDKKKDKYIVTAAIAYTYKNGENIIYASDSSGMNVISKDGKEFPEDKIDEFDKFQFTLTIDKDGNYQFESIEKVK